MKGKREQGGIRGGVSSYHLHGADAVADMGEVVCMGESVRV